jgi:hypothetical protein
VLGDNGCPSNSILGKVHFANCVGTNWCLFERWTTVIHY